MLALVNNARDKAIEEVGVESPDFFNVFARIYAELVVEECEFLLESHAQGMDKHGFESKAYTARICAGIIKEHFGLKGK